MPYKVVKRGESYAVKSEGSGRILGVHPTKEEAEAQVRAIYANTHEGE